MLGAYQGVLYLILFDSSDRSYKHWGSENKKNIVIKQYWEIAENSLLWQNKRN